MKPWPDQARSSALYSRFISFSDSRWAFTLYASLRRHGQSSGVTATHPSVSPCHRRCGPRNGLCLLLYASPRSQVPTSSRQLTFRTFTVHPHTRPNCCGTIGVMVHPRLNLGPQHKSRCVYLGLVGPEHERMHHPRHLSAAHALSSQNHWGMLSLSRPRGRRRHVSAHGSRTSGFGEPLLRNVGCPVDRRCCHGVSDRW